MHLWRCSKWKQFIGEHPCKQGLRLHFEPGVDPAVRCIFMDFAAWLRREFCFPFRLNVYIKSAYRIRAMDGDLVVGTCWQPASYNESPYIRLAAGDYRELVALRGQTQAMWSVLWTFAQELTCYFQHINHIELTPRGEQRQASNYAQRVLEEYDDYLAFCDHEYS